MCGWAWMCTCGEQGVSLNKRLSKDLIKESILVDQLELCTPVCIHAPVNVCTLWECLYVSTSTHFYS